MKQLGGTNYKKIRNDIAITGEINLQGQVTAIGGLDAKILGGIRAGVKTFLYPESNRKDFEDFMEKYAEKAFLEGIVFVQIDCIEQVNNHLSRTFVFVEQLKCTYISTYNHRQFENMVLLKMWKIEITVVH
jgi:ATP-dependent Lon protease